MATKNSFVETVSQIASDGVQKGIFHLYTEDEKLTGNKLHLKNKEVINFGSCSYLGLEFDRRMKDSAIRAIENYGTQFSESRSYVSTSHYLVLEKLLNIALPVTSDTSLSADGPPIKTATLIFFILF